MRLTLDALVVLDAIDRAGGEAAGAAQLFRVPSAVSHSPPATPPTAPPAPPAAPTPAAPAPDLTNRRAAPSFAHSGGNAQTTSTLRRAPEIHADVERRTRITSR